MLSSSHAIAYGPTTGVAVASPDRTPGRGRARVVRFVIQTTSPAAQKGDEAYRRRTERRVPSRTQGPPPVICVPVHAYFVVRLSSVQSSS